MIIVIDSGVHGFLVLDIVSDSEWNGKYMRFDIDMYPGVVDLCCRPFVFLRI